MVLGYINTSSNQDGALSIGGQPLDNQRTGLFQNNFVKNR